MGSHYYNDDNLLHKNLDFNQLLNYTVFIHRKYFQNMKIASNVFQINNFKQYWYVP